MGKMSQAKVTYDDGREDQFREMMAQLGVVQSKYKGVRGELLAKVRAELAKLEPASTTTTASVVVAAKPSPPVVTGAPAIALPSCRVCGRGMKVNGAEGNLICQNGHVRLM